jgi:formimidoylglutamate deiminase
MTTGIGLTHLPVLYCHGGAGRKPMEGGQWRFGNDLDAFSNLLQLCQTHAKALPSDTVVGVAPHSLRATDADILKAVPALAAGSPVHIHIAEQPKEVADIEAWLGQRPVQWLLSHVPVDKTWCTIHATHMKDDEVQRLAATNAVAGLCPVTEANLGDGIFPGSQWLAAGGAFAVGTDSNVNISMVEELRLLEYGQRLREMSRNVMISETGSVGAFLYRQAAKGSAQALQRNAGVIAEGKLADLLAINSQHVSLCALSENALLDGLCFASRPGMITDVWSAGRHAVKAGQHVARQAVEEQYRKAMHDIMALL